MRKLDTLCLLVTSMSCKVKVLGPPLVEESAFSDDLNRKVIVKNFVLIGRYSVTQNIFILFIFFVKLKCIVIKKYNYDVFHYRI